MEELLDEPQVVIGEAVYAHENGVDVRIRPHGDVWEIAGTRHHASWTHADHSGDEYGLGERIRAEELEKRKADAVEAARALPNVE